MPDIYFQCSCGKNLAVEASRMGRTVHCPDCDAGLVVPDASIQCNCPRCGITMQAPAEMAGKWVQCLGCSSKIQVAEPLPEPEGELELGAPAPVTGPPGENLLTGMDRFFKQCPQCHERIPSGTQQCPFCEYSYAKQTPNGLIIGVLLLCGVIAAAVFLGLWRAKIWPFTSSRPPAPMLTADTAPTATELPPEPDTDEPVPLPTAGSQKVSLANDNIPDSLSESNNAVAIQSEWSARVALSRQFISARMDKTWPRCVSNTLVSLRQIDGLVINGTNSGLEPGAIRLSMADKSVLVEFKNLDVYNRLQADEVFRVAWINAQALALSRRSLEQEGLKISGLLVDGEEFADRALLLGDPQAQYQMGERSYRQRDYATAVLFLQAAAAQQHAQSQYFLGVIYLQGLGVNADQHQSFKWMALAAAQGSAKAEQFLEQRKLSAEARQKLLRQEQARQDKESQAFKAFLGQPGLRGQERPAGLQQAL